ncbi:hypothetical protein ACIQJ4_34975 [Streptomyces filamentosus]
MDAQGTGDGLHIDAGHLFALAQLQQGADRGRQELFLLPSALWGVA